jgi:protein disulfide-isomerase
MYKIQTAIIMIFLIFAPLQAESMYYNGVDATALVSKKQAEADRTSKTLLVIFGADWCPDCWVLHDLLQDPLLEQVLTRYIVVKIDVGRYDRNLELAKELGLDLKHGIPGAIAITKNNITWVTTGQWSKARTMHAEELLPWLKK